MADKTIADALAAIFTKKVAAYVLTAVISSAITYAVSHGWIEQTLAADIAKAVNGIIGAVFGSAP